MGLTDTLLVIAILSFLGLIGWSRIFQQSMLDTFREIKTMLSEMREDKR